MKLLAIFTKLTMFFSLSTLAAPGDPILTPERLAQRFRGVAPSVSPWFYSDYFDTALAAARVTKNSAYLELILQQGSALTRSTALNRDVVDVATGKKPAALVTSEYLCDSRSGQNQAAYLVHHGVVWAPLVAAAREYLVSQSGQISREARNQIIRIVGTAMAGLNYFSYQVGGSPARYLGTKIPGLCADEVPLIGKVLPLNMSAAGGNLALELIEFFKLKDSLLNSLSPNYVKNAKIYVERQTQNLQYALNSTIPFIQQGDSGGLVWRYRPEGRVEDTSHAGLVTEFLSKANSLGFVGANYISGVKKTFLFMIKDGPTRVPSNLTQNRGTTFGEAKFVQGITRWIDLGRKDCLIVNKVKDILEYQDQQSNYPFYTLKADYKMRVYAKTCR